MKSSKEWNCFWIILLFNIDSIYKWTTKYTAVSIFLRKFGNVNQYNTHTHMNILHQPHYRHIKVMAKTY